MRYVSVILCGITLSSVAYAQVYKRTQPRLPEPTKEITKDTKTGAMLGVDSGFNLVMGHDSDRFVVDAGLRLGYNLFFTKTWGMRLYGSYSYSFSDFVTAYRDVAVINDLYANTHTFLFNADVLYDFYNNNDLKLSLGIIFGLGAGYELGAQKTYRDNGNLQHTQNYTKSGFKAVANAGFSLTFESRHRLEILYRYAILQPDLRNIVRDTNNPPNVIREEIYKPQSPFSFHLGYSYTF